jgi:hypothetical protein
VDAAFQKWMCDRAREHFHPLLRRIFVAIESI